MPAHVDLIVLGRLLGTYEEWDSIDDFEEFYTNFKPAEGVYLPACVELIIDFKQGTWVAQNDADATISTGDLATLCASLPRR